MAYPRNEVSERKESELRFAARMAYLDGRNKRAKALTAQADKVAKQLSKAA